MNQAPARSFVFLSVIGLSCLLSLGALAADISRSPAPDAAFVKWAQQSLHPIKSLDMTAPTNDLMPLRRMIGDAQLVLLAEGQHFAAEPLAFRNRLFKYLVAELGFEAIAIESGITEGRVANDYVLGGPGALDSALSQGISHTFHLLPQNKELIRWMRDYNADSRHGRKIQFFGVDVPGSPTNVNVPRGPDTAIVEVLSYLVKVEPTQAAAFSSRLNTVIPKSGWTIDDYLTFSGPTRDALTALIADLNSLLERRQLSYIERSSPNDYAWALRNTVAARQFDNAMRRIPLGAKAEEYQTWLGEQVALRDRVMADNAEWILGQLGAGKKVLFFAANGHVANTTYVVNGDLHVPLGVYLKERFKSKMLTIGNIGAVRGSIGGCERTMELRPMPPTSANAKLAQFNEPLFLLDLRSAPASATWLQQPSDVWNGFASDPMAISKAYDVIFFSGTFSPACSVQR